jgi:hypothetical protein
MRPRATSAASALGRRPDGRRAAFTLVEVLLAMTLASAVAITVVSWVAHEKALAARITREADAVTSAFLVERLLRDDVLQAVIRDQPRLVLAGGALQLVTGNLAGDEPPGLARVVWSFDAGSRTLSRARTLDDGPTQSRTVTRRLEQVSFAVAGGAVTCRWSAGQDRQGAFSVAFAAPGASDQ